MAVAQSGGYTSASQKLGLSQSTVSSHVAKLEHQLGVQLLRYDNRKVTLTQVGEQVYESAKLMLLEQDHLFETARTPSSSQLRFGASIAFEQDFFFDRVITPFIRHNSNILFKLWFGHSVELAERIHDGDLDLALILAWKVPADLRPENAGSVDFRFLISKDHPLAGKVVTPATVASLGIITAPLDSLEWSYYSRVLSELNLSPSDVKLEISGIQARMIAARHGLGVVGTFYPSYADPQSIEGLVPLQLDRPVPRVQTNLLRSRKNQANSAAIALANWIKTIE